MVLATTLLVALAAAPPALSAAAAAPPNPLSCFGPPLTGAEDKNLCSGSYKRQIPDVASVSDCANHCLADATCVQFVFAALSFAALTWLNVTSDFSVLNVYENSHSLKPMLYKITGVWGNHEGSMLLWVLILQ